MSKLNGLTIAEMHKQLGELMAEGHSEKKLVMSVDYGDRLNTLQALPVQSMSIGETCESAYSDSGLAMICDEDENKTSIETVVAMNF